MDRDYCEIICTAIDEIVTSKLEGLRYDVTKLCTITDASQSYQGKYIVSDGTAKYEAYSTDLSYKKGNTVLVTIPNGDYQLQKTILCRVSADDTTPFNYTSPMDTMIKITNNIFDNANVVYGENIGLLANENNRSSAIGPIYSLTEPGQFSGFTRLGVTADFKSLLNGLDVASGSYGIKILIYTEILTSPGIIENGVYELTFSSADMIGNPYQFESYFYQEKVFDISNINGIKQIDVYFYQDGQFYDGNNNYINWQYEDSILDAQKMPNNLFVDNVKIYMGYEMGAFTEETLMIFTNDPLTYHYTNEDLSRDINLRWIHKIEDNKFELLNSSNITNKFEIKWFQYKPGCELIDQYAGKDWEQIPPNPELFSCTIAVDVKQQREQIKVIGLIHETTGIDEDGEDIITPVPYYSNLLIFENEEHVPDAITYDVSTSLSIVCEDGSEGNYFIYNQNGKIINEGEGQGKKRYLKALYQGAEITSSIGKLDYIKWYLPIEKTMLQFSDIYYTENNGEKADEITKYKGVDYDSVTRKAELFEATQTNELTSTKQAFAIGNQWNYENANNTVRCIVSINGIIYEAIEELHFGKSGTNGTNTTFLIEIANNENALIINDNPIDKNTLMIKARLYDANGSNVGFTPEQANTIQWSWMHDNYNQDYILLPNRLLGDNITLTCNTTQIPKDNYFILKAKYGMLEAYLPIPLKTRNTSHIEGAREIIYNNMGTPSYYSDAYTAFYLNKDTYLEDTKIIWELDYEEEFEKKLTEGYIPKLINLQSKPNYKGLSASPFYASGYNDKVCVHCYNSETQCGWSQPILIMQSKYDFAMLNQWDGSLTLDEDNSTILSTMLGAGRKNSDNTFSGVLIGDIQTGTGNSVDTNTLTGVYGLHEGQISYTLKEDGTASFGKNGKGQILIDGNESTIKSASRISTNGGTGMEINLNDGIIDIIEGPSEKARFTLTSINNTKLINIDKNNYYLQSDKYTTEDGTKLDLSNGTYTTAGASGKVIIQPENPYLEIQGLYDKNFKNLLHVGTDGYYLQSADYSADKKSGMHINLKQGRIIGYNLYLAGYNSDGKSIVIDSSAAYPLKIGSKFKVNYDGTLECDGANIKNANITNAHISNLTGDNGRDITIGEHFYVSPSGNMTASGASISGNISAGGLTTGGGAVTIKGVSVTIGGATLTGSSNDGLSITPAVESPGFVTSNGAVIIDGTGIGVAGTLSVTGTLSTTQEPTFAGKTLTNFIKDVVDNMTVPRAAYAARANAVGNEYANLTYYEISNHTHGAGSYSTGALGGAVSGTSGSASCS